MPRQPLSGVTRTRLKLVVALVFASIVSAACYRSEQKRFSIAASKSYEASLFRQHCAVCHGPEGEGRTLDDGTKVPSLREGEFKFRSEEEVLRQISEGGHGMTPFRKQLTDRELRMMAEFVRRDLRGQ